MSADWIKMRVGLRDEPEVISIAAALELSEDEVVGKLQHFWSWADAKCAFGDATGVTEKWVDRYVGATGFAAALVMVGWLVVTEAGINIPGFDLHMGKSAKKRANTAKRMAMSRSKCDKSDAAGVTDVTQRASPKASPEKEKEKEKETPPPPTPSAAPPVGGASPAATACGGGGGKDFDFGLNSNSGSSSGSEGVWQQLETRILNNGVRLAAKLVGELRSRAIEPTAVTKIIDFFEQKKPRWGSGALYSRLQAQRSGIDPLLLWPEPDQSLQRRDEATRKQAEMQRENEAGAARRQQDQADRDRLEQDQGPALDALDKGAIRQLIADHFPEDLIELYQKRLGRSDTPQGTLRVELLSVLEQAGGS